MTPADKTKPNPATAAQPAPIELTGKLAVAAPVVLAALIVTAAVMITMLVNSDRVDAMKTAPVVPSTTRILSSKDLDPFTLLTETHVLVLQGQNDKSDARLKQLLGRYLLTKVPAGTEIKPDMVAPAEANALLANCVAVTIPATATSSLGGQLRVGDLVDLLLIPAKPSAANQPDQSKPLPFENLLVLNLSSKKVDEKSPAELTAITLALQTDKRDDFASALPGATIVLTHKVFVR